MSDNPFDAFLARYRNDIPRFTEEVLGIKPDPWQKQVMEWVQDGERRISIRSAHGPGKTALASWLMIHRILCYLPQKTVATSPTAPQLFDGLMAELKTNILKMKPALQKLLDVRADRVTLVAAPDESFISARTSRAESPESLQGIHSASVLLIVDEASGVPEQVFEAAAGSMSGEHATTVLLSNPVRTSGYFFNTHNKDRAQWQTMKVSAYDSPRISQAYIDEMRERYGEESPAFRIRVLGDFPKTDEDSVIAMDLVESAVNRDVETNPLAPVVWGLDCARFGGDRSALAKRQANRLLEPIRTFKDKDLMELVGAVKAEYDSLPPSSRPLEILVDSIGLGAGVVDRMQELGMPVRGINVSESSSMKDAFLNSRAELWYACRDWFAKKDVTIPKDETLIAELTTPRYKYSSTGKLLVESKADMKKRGLASPDVADALVLSFASTSATALHGRAYSWAKPIRRGLSVV